MSEGLAYIMNELFGGVVYAGIDTDKHRYPIGELIVNIYKHVMSHILTHFYLLPSQVLVALHLTTRRAFWKLYVQDSLK